MYGIRSSNRPHTFNKIKGTTAQMRNYLFMYILIKIGTNNFRSNEKVSKQKSKIEDYLKQKGFYWSNKLKRYIDDKTSGIDGGSGTDYIITHCDELV